MHQTYAQSISITAQVPLSAYYASVIANNSVVYVIPDTSQTGEAVSLIAQIRDDSQTPLSGHLVVFGYEGVTGGTITETNDTTNSKGEVSGTFVAAQAGVYQIFAIDKTFEKSDNTDILIASQPDVTYTGATIPLTPTPTIIPTSSVTNVPTPAEKYEKQTHIVMSSLTPTIATVPSMNPTSTITPTRIPSPVAEIPYWINVLSVNVCSSINYLLYIIILLCIPPIIIFCIRRKGRYGKTVIAVIIAFVTFFLLRFLCLSFLGIGIVWLLANLILLLFRNRHET